MTLIAAIPALRRIGIVKAGDTLRCPAGHRFRDPLVWNEGGLRCSHRSSNGKDDCGKLVLLLGGGLTNFAGEHIYLLVEVTAEEMQTMRRAHMNWQQMVRYLDLQFEDVA